jgi:hypothetical protein
MQTLIFASGILQSEVVVPYAANAANAVRSGTLKGGEKTDSPNTNEPALRIAFDLHCKQKHLQRNDADKQKQRSMPGGGADHICFSRFLFRSS